MGARVPEDAGRVPPREGDGLPPGPVFAIVGGPFGAGKTTFAASGGLALLGCAAAGGDPPPRYLRVGRIAHAFSSVRPFEPPLERDFDDAWKAAMRVVEECLVEGRSVALESSLRQVSGLSNLARSARLSGIPLHLGFLSVTDAETLVRRVADRGGAHEPAPDSIRRCHMESFIGFCSLALEADRLLVLDADALVPRPAFEALPREGASRVLDGDAWSALPEAVRRAALRARDAAAGEPPC